jgi:rhodopsin domain-containing protein
VALKISLVIFILRNTRSSKQQTVLFAAVAINTVVGVVKVLYTIFSCGIYRDGYAILTQGPVNNCGPNAGNRGIGLGHAAATMTTDLVLFIISLLILRYRDLSIREKLGTASIMGLALLAVVAAILRFPYIDYVTTIEDGFFGILCHPIHDCKSKTDHTQVLSQCLLSGLPWNLVSALSVAV